MAFKDIKNKLTKNLGGNKTTEEQLQEDTNSLNNEKEESKQKNNSNKNLISSVLQVKEKTELDDVMTTDDIRNVAFTLVAPTGYDPKEVSHFMNTIKSDINKYQTVIKQRDEDVSKLYKELSRVEYQLQETQQKSELAAFMSEKQDKVDELRDRLVNLQMENMELKETIDKLKNSQSPNIEENNPLPKIDKLPPLNNDKKILPDLDQDDKETEGIDVDILNDKQEKEDQANDSFLSMLDELNLD